MTGKIKSSTLFKKRYADEIAYIPNLNLLNNWDEDQFFYLRRNKKGRAITVWDRGDNMSQISDTNVCVNFVADAFNEFSDRYRLKINAGFTPYAKMKMLTAENAYVRPASSHAEHLNRMEEVFLIKVLQPEKDKILTFDDFMFQFDRFIKIYAKNYPILYSTYVSSHFCSLHSTGMMIELKNEDHNDDKVRKDYALDPELHFFTDLAAEYGFTVPKYAPWCIVANLDSQVMIDYAIQYDALDKKQVIDEYYYECKDYDMDLLKGFIFKTLDNFLLRFPNVKTSKVCKDGSIQVSLNARNFESPEVLFEKTTDKYMLRKYIEVMLAEKDIGFDKLLLDILFEECYYMYSKFGMDYAYTFIEMKILKSKPDRIR